MDKFNDDYAKLSRSYAALEKRFTEKCQQLAQLKRQFDNPPEKPEPKQPEPPKQIELTDDFLRRYVFSNEKILCKAVRYALSLPEGLPKVMTSGGCSNASAPKKPKSVEEASHLAKNFFN